MENDDGLRRCICCGEVYLRNGGIHCDKCEKLPLETLLSKSRELAKKNNLEV